MLAWSLAQSTFLLKSVRLVLHRLFHDSGREARQHLAQSALRLNFSVGLTGADRLEAERLSSLLKVSTAEPHIDT